MTPSEKLSIVNEFRKSAPVDVDKMAQALGVTVHDAYLSDDLSGMIAPTEQGSYVITVNASHPYTRRRFTIAHELGHFLLHKHLIGSGVDDDIAYRSSSSGRYKNTAIGPKEETEANKIAAAILMPNDLVSEYVEKHGKQPKILAQEFGVSEHAMSIRIGVPYS